MHVVIDIPNDYIKTIMVNQRTEGTAMDKLLRQAVIDGTQLPEDHGRLIDADAAVAEATKKMKYPSNHKYMECVIAHMNLAPTIVRKDYGSLEEEYLGNPVAKTGIYADDVDAPKTVSMTDTNDIEL